MNIFARFKLNSWTKKYIYTFPALTTGYLNVVPQAFQAAGRSYVVSQHPHEYWSMYS